MPTIMRHQSGEWRPVQAWPESCQVQWGGSGLVFGKEGARRTAFFEAFPDDGAGGFIRGEGTTLDEAEANAFAKWQRQHECYLTGGHRWSRTRRYRNGETSTYTNGGCFCLKCRAFETAMKPIVKLGDWRSPLSASELHLLTMGAARPDDDRQRSRRDARELELRAKMFGVPIPNWRDPMFTLRAEWPQTDPYEQACTEAVVQFYARHHAAYQQNPSPDSLFASLMNGLFMRDLHQMAMEAGLIAPGPTH